MKPSIKKVFAIILTIILGAIGAGIWDHFLEPGFKIFSGVILKIITLGIKGLEDDIFLSIAKGFHEISSLLVLVILFGIISGFLFGIVVYNARSLSPKEDKNISNEGSSDVQRYRFILILMIIFFIVIMTWSGFRNAYINDQITYYHQLYDTVAPFIDEEEKLMIKSNFAQIKNKNDYDVIINQLKKIADENNQTYTEYTILY